MTTEQIKFTGTVAPGGDAPELLLGADLRAHVEFDVSAVAMRTTPEGDTVRTYTFAVRRVAGLYDADGEALGGDR